MRRFLSHILIGFATFALTSTFFIWTLDNRVLEPETFNAELRKAGVTEEITALLPNILSGESEVEVADQVVDTQQRIEIENKKFDQAIDKVLTLSYVDQKVSSLTTSVLTYVREGEPQPTLDLRDFPDRLRTEGVNPGGELVDSFAQPIELNKDGTFEPIRKGYRIFSLLKYVGVGVFVALLTTEWFVASRGEKLKRISRIFLYAGFSYILYWGLIILVPKYGGQLVNTDVNANFDASGLIQSILNALKGLFSFYFLTFGLTCLAVATLLYVIRHYRHGDVMKDSNDTARK